MKRILLFLLALLAICPLRAQRNTREEIAADIERTGGVHFLYPMDQPAPTPAPKGYKPFYVSHLGRHGARYALGGRVYEEVLAVWTSAQEKDLLTEEGKQFFEEYLAIYPTIARREGILTQKGQAQHRYIASQIYKNYPDVFKGPTRAEAVSTESHRVIVSMFSFLSQLDGLDKDFSFKADYGQPYQAYLLPAVIDSNEEREGEALTKFGRFLSGVLDLDAILARWFTQPGKVVKNKYKFVFDMHTVLSTLDNLDVPVPEHLYQLYTPEERYTLWRVNNYRDYQLLGLSPDTRNLRPKAMKALYEDFVNKAQADWADGVQLRLRFAHDSTLMPFMSLLGINGMGEVVENPFEVENYWRNYDVPMACNLQLIFFKSKKSPEILFQILLNGRETTLPLEMAAPGSFYRWEDFKSITIKSSFDF